MMNRGKKKELERYLKLVDGTRTERQQASLEEIQALNRKKIYGSHPHHIDLILTLTLIGRYRL